MRSKFQSRLFKKIIDREKVMLKYRFRYFTLQLKNYGARRYVRADELEGHKLPKNGLLNGTPEYFVDKLFIDQFKFSTA